MARGRAIRLWRAILAEPLGLIGGTIVLAFLMMALFAPWIAPYDPLKIDVMNKFAAPSLLHPAGTDQLGRDLLSRLIYGARTALGVAITATGIAGLGGILLGLIAGYGPRWLDSILLLCFDSVTSLPMIMCALAVITVLGPSTGTLIFVIILVSIPGYARFIRAQTLSLVRSDFILAEKAMNASHARIILLHLLPNVAGQLLVILYGYSRGDHARGGPQLLEPWREAAGPLVGQYSLRWLCFAAAITGDGRHRWASADPGHAGLHLSRRIPARCP